MSQLSKEQHRLLAAAENAAFGLDPKKLTLLTCELHEEWRVQYTYGRRHYLVRVSHYRTSNNEDRTNILVTVDANAPVSIDYLAVYVARRRTDECIAQSLEDLINDKLRSLKRRRQQS